ncbi:cornifelin-like [Thamnophis elegans]|uniref:cornifelin-like n=1 Tax=Thamnophis elegans TaxID=35005 RepID=UPI0013770F39|nr:cornifelin-like [Thamnophis elegans]
MAFRSFPVVSSQPCTIQPCPAEPSTDTRSCPAPYRDWKSDLTDCCADKQTCICGTLAPCVLACQVAASLGECCCLPILPGALVALRTGLREQQRIKVFLGLPGFPILSPGKDHERERRLGREGKG